MSLEAKAKTFKVSKDSLLLMNKFLEERGLTDRQELVEFVFCLLDESKTLKMRLENAEKEIQKLEEKCANYCNLEVATIKKYEDLHSDFISQSEAWQKTINKNKVLESRLALIRSLIKEFPEIGRAHV